MEGYERYRARRAEEEPHSADYLTVASKDTTVQDLYSADGAITKRKIPPSRLEGVVIFPCNDVASSPPGKNFDHDGLSRAYDDWINKPDPVQTWLDNQKAEQNNG